MTATCRKCGYEMTVESETVASVCPRCGRLMLAPKDANSQETQEKLHANFLEMQARQKKNKRKRRVIALVLTAVIVLGAGTAALAVLLGRQARYAAAADALEQGDPYAAYEQFDALGDYQDAPEQREKAREQFLTTVQSGDCISFGSFEQDGNTKNGKEPLEWIVLSVKEPYVLLLSKNVLDVQPFSETESAAWSDSALRRWLNVDFFADAFAPGQQAQILLAKRTDAKGDETAERFLALSAEAVDMYLAPDDPHRLGVCTAYAAAKSDGVPAGGNVAWWLRTPGTKAGCTAVVNAQGETDAAGIPADSAAVGVRPAFWLHLS